MRLVMQARHKSSRLWGVPVSDLAPHREPRGGAQQQQQGATTQGAGGAVQGGEAAVQSEEKQGAAQGAPPLRAVKQEPAAS